MKKLLTALVILTLATSVFASTQLKFSGTYAIFGGDNGRTIRRATVDLDESSYVVATGKEEATVFAENYTLSMRPNTLAVLSNDGGLGVYVLYGSATLTKDDTAISLYTPTTYLKAEGKGEFAVVSTDEEELLMNFSHNAQTTYDAIKGKMIEVPAAYGYDYMHSKVIPLDYSYATTTEELVVAESTPATPIYVESAVENPKVTVEEIKSEMEKAGVKVPGTPVFVDVLQTIQNAPAAPEGMEVKEQSVVGVPEVPGGIKVTQTLIFIPDRPLFASDPIQVIVD